MTCIPPTSGTTAVLPVPPVRYNDGMGSARGGRRSARAVVPDSSWADLDGPVHYLDYGGDPSGPLVVCVHGLGGSAVNWAAVAPTLTESCRVVALDLAGFGRTRGGTRPTTIEGNRATGESYTIAHHLYTEDGIRKIMIASIRYLDTFAKIDQSWYFAERNLILDWSETRLLGTGEES